MKGDNSLDASELLVTLAESASIEVSNFIKENPEANVVFMEAADANAIALEFSIKFPDEVKGVIHAVIDSKSGEFIGIAEHSILHVFIEPVSLRVLGFRKFSATC